MTGQDDTTTAATEQTPGSGSRHSRLASLRSPESASTSLAGVVDACFDLALGFLAAQREVVKGLASTLRGPHDPTEASADVEWAEPEQAERAERERAEREQTERAEQEQAERAERERAEQEQAERAEREQAEAAERAERERAQRDEEAKRTERVERYRGLSKVQLVEELRQRGLPRGGTKPQLVERLLGADDN